MIALLLMRPTPVNNYEKAKNIMRHFNCYHYNFNLSDRVLSAGSALNLFQTFHF